VDFCPLRSGSDRLPFHAARIEPFLRC
jgi:hypothetical protein